jgi:hypothetical protein
LSEIYLDTNVLPQSGSLDTLGFSILVAFARETGHALALPELVAEEATSQRLRTIEAVFDLLEKAHRDARSYANIPLLPDLPIPGELAREFGSKLKSFFRIIPLPEGAGEEALRRETYRIRPAREGKGARDCAIWLAVKSAHKLNGAEGYFVSGNVKDFADPDDRSRLHPDLRAEIEGPELHLATSIEDLLRRLAAEEAAFINNSFLKDNEECSRAVIRAIGDINLAELVQQIPDAPAGGSKSRFYVAGPVLATPLGVNEGRAFCIEGRRTGIAWTRWKLVVPVGILEKLGAGMRQAVVEVPCQGAFQIWARLQATSVEADVQSVSPIKVIDY